MGNEHLLQLNMKINAGEIISGINNMENSVLNMIKQVQNLSNTFKVIDTSKIDADVFKQTKQIISDVGIKTNVLAVGMSGLREAFNDAAEGGQQMAVLEQFDEYSKKIMSFNELVSIASDGLIKLNVDDNLSDNLAAAVNEANKMSLEFNDIIKSARNAYAASSDIKNLNIEGANIIDPNQLKLVSDLDVALSAASKRIGQINDKNAEYVNLQKESLELAMENLKGLEHLPEVHAKIGKSQAVIELLNRNIVFYQKNGMDVMNSHSDLLELIVKSDINRLKLTKEQISNFKKLLPVLRGMSNLTQDIVRDMGLTEEELKKIQEFGEKIHSNAKGITKEHVTWKDLISDIEKSFQAIDLVVPGFAQFGQVLHPLKMIGQEIRSINELYEKNATVNAVFMKGMYDSYNATAAMAEASYRSAEGQALLGETQAALTAILNSGQAAAISTTAEMESLTESVAVMSRVTGISASELADLQTRFLGLTGSIREASQLSNVFINVQANARLSTQQMQQMTNLLTRDLGRLDRAYQIINKDGERVMSGTAAIAAGMGAMAEAAAKAGGSSQAALDILTRAIQNPISQAVLLGPALMESDPSKQFLMMGERAHMFHEQLKNMPTAIQAAFAQKLGTTPQELESLSKATIDYRKALEGVTDSNERQAILERFATEHRNKAADASNAASIKQEAYENSTRRLQNAFNSIRIIFSRVAAALQPVLDIIAALMENPITRWVLIAAGAALTLYTVVSKLSKGLGLLQGVFGGVGKAAGDMVKSATGDGGGFINWIKDFITKLGEIPIIKALKASLVLVLVGAALAAGIAMMGLALNIMPPDKAFELAIVVGGIVAAAYVVTLMAPIIKPALIGALGLILVGAALAAGIALIGLASNLLDPEKTGVLLTVIGGLLAAMVVCAIIGLIIVPALIGALGMVAIAGALAASIAILSTVQGPSEKAAKAISILASAISSISIGSAVALGLLAMSLSAFAMTLTGAAVVGIFVDFTDIAGKFANSLNILMTPISRLANMGHASNVLIKLSDGLSRFANSLSYGGWFTRIPDFIEVANRLAVAINRLIAPASRLGGLGTNAGNVLFSMGQGLSKFAESLDVGGFFGSPDFAKHATSFARSLNALYAPVNAFARLGEGASDILRDVAGAINTLSVATTRKIDTRNIETLGNAIAKISDPLHARMVDSAEEIRSNLAVEIQSSMSRKEDIIIERLEEIRDAIKEQEDTASLEELKLMNKTLKSMVSEMSMSAMMGTVADTRYNV